MKSFDCIVCGEVCVDLPVYPIDQQVRLRDLETVRIQPIEPGGGGLVANCGTVMARLGLQVAAFCVIGQDLWGKFLGEWLVRHRVNVDHVLQHQTAPTSVTAVLVGETGDHTFAYHGGASQQFNRQTVDDNIQLFERSKFALFGYYSLMPQLQDDLAEVLQTIRATGCRTALDTAGGGGSLKPLDRILPHLDLYIPSIAEAQSQTGLHEPKEIISTYRSFCPTGLLGVKLGEQGALLSPADNQWIAVQAVEPPGAVLDTTGAGDSFYAGLITGLVRGHAIEDAGRIAAAAGACSVTGIGALAGIRDFEETCHIAGVKG
jgi:sugar/nucleoside kinase (ribokinase family)